MKYLGIDFGTKRVGIASSDDAGRLAFPLDVFLNTPDLISHIQKLCVELEIGSIVIGQSHNLNGNPNEVMKDIESFVEKLKKVINIPIEYEMEYFTSVSATYFQRQDEDIDARAAALILQRYLDRKNNDRS